MQLPDVDVLVNAFRPDAPRHVAYRAWLEALVSGERRFAMSDLVLCSVVRILTNRKIYQPPEPIAAAFEYAEFIRSRPLCVLVTPGPRHWQIFSRLCRDGNVGGGRMSDAYLAALAVEHGCEWITADQQFARFPGLRWRHPLD